MEEEYLRREEERAKSQKTEKGFSIKEKNRKI